MALKSDWVGVSGNTYHLYTDLLTWEEANDFAQSLGGYLVKVDDINENAEIYENVIAALSNDEIMQTVSVGGGSGSYIWLGGSDADNEGTWTWVRDGSTFSTSRTEWADSGELGVEPDGAEFQNYLAMGLTVWPNEPAFDLVGGIGVPSEWNDIDSPDNPYVTDGSNISRLFSVVEFDATTPTQETVEYQGIPYSLSVIVAPGILGADPVLLKNLNEVISEPEIGIHTVEYNGATFNYDDIDHLIMTVSRDDIFTSDFAAEISESFPAYAGITYSEAVTLVGVNAIDDILLTVAGADGNYIG